MNPNRFFRPGLIALALFLTLCLAWQQEQALAAPIGTNQTPGWMPPVAGPVIRLFERPVSKYAAGHRGIDYVAVQDEPILSPSSGIVSFVGIVFDRTVVVVTHPNGIQSEVEPICPLVAPGEPVVEGEPLGTFCIPETGYALHCLGVPCLHFSIRKDGEYYAPQILLGGLSPTRLLKW